MRIIIAIILSVCVGRIWAQQDSTIIDYSYADNYKKEFHYTHTTEKCKYLMDSGTRSIKVSSSLASVQKCKPCPYCTLGMEYTLQSRKIYVPIYISKVHEFNLGTNEEHQMVWTDAEKGCDSKYGPVWIGIAHERLTSSKISAIKAAHAAVILNSITSGLSATASLMSARRGNVSDTRLFSFMSLNSAIQAGFTTSRSKLVEDLEIAVVIKNITNQEIQINNESRGMGWHLLPGQTIEFGDINTFSDLLRVEESSIEGKNVTYYAFDVRNYLLKVETEVQNEAWRSFRSLPLEDATEHHFETKPKHSNAILYEYNIETGEHRRVDSN